MIHRFRLAALIFSLAVVLYPGAAFAAPSKAPVTVEVKNSTDAGAKNLSKMYVVMYSVAVVDDEWWGKKVQVKKIPAGKKTVSFVVKPGQVVDFLTFETAEDVNTNKKRQFYAPPMKNFAGTSDTGKLCFVAGVDFSKKMSDMQACTNELELVYAGADAKVSVGVNDGVDDTKPLSGVFVGMYNVAVSNNEWWGELVQVKPIPAGKKQAVFSVTPGQIVDFLVFKNDGDAQKVKKYMFTVPPHKNFSSDYGPNDTLLDGFCMIAGIDIAKKLEFTPGVYSCGNELELVLKK